MLSRNKRKLDSKVRFQHKDFTNRLNQARAFKRNPRKASEGKFRAVLDSLGLGGRTSKFFLVLGLLLLVYLVYVPNFLFIKQIKVEGVDAFAAGSIQGTVEEYFHDSSSLWPQRNIVFLSEKNLKSYLTEHNPAVLKVKFIKRHLTRSITVGIEPRVEKFLFTNSQSSLILYNDGVAARLVPEGQLPGGFFRIQISTNSEIRPGDRFIPQPAVEAVSRVFADFKNKTQKTVDYVEIPVDVSAAEPAASGSEDASFEEKIDFNELILHIKKDESAKDSNRDFKVFVNLSNENIDKSMTRLEILIPQLPPDKFNALYYIDMRFKDKAYVCFKNAVCAKVAPAAPLQAPAILKPGGTEETKTIK